MQPTDTSSDTSSYQPSEHCRNGSDDNKKVSASATSTSHGVTNSNWFASVVADTDADSQPASKLLTSNPPTYRPKESYDQVITKALNKLSLQERDRAYEVIHGVAEDVKETKDFMKQKLQELEDCLNSISNKPAYDLAVRQNRSYIYDRAFRVKFLRSEDYSAMDAAKRVVRYCSTKLDIWGEEKLAEEITFASLSELGQQTIQTAKSLQLLPERDTSGRAVIFSFEKHNHEIHKTDRPEIFVAQLFWYFLMSAAEDEETQKKGVVYIIYALDYHPTMNEKEQKLFWNCCAIGNAVPLRAACMRYCVDDHNPALKPIMALMSVGMQHSVRCRMRVHYGTHQEVKYSLMQFGLPVKQFPLSHKGECTTQFLERFWNYRCKTEADPARYKGATYVPKRIDVLSGRGKPQQLHDGNQNFHEFLVPHYEEYNAAPRLDRSEIASKIVIMIKSTQVRFLKKDEHGIWIETSFEEAKKKVGHGLRRHREMQKALEELKQDRERGLIQSERRSEEATKRPRMAGGLCTGCF